MNSLFLQRSSCAAEEAASWTGGLFCWQAIACRNGTILACNYEDIRLCSTDRDIYAAATSYHVTVPYNATITIDLVPFVVDCFRSHDKDIQCWIWRGWWSAACSKEQQQHVDLQHRAKIIVASSEDHRDTSNDHKSRVYSTAKYIGSAPPCPALQSSCFCFCHTPHSTQHLKPIN